MAENAASEMEPLTILEHAMNYLLKSRGITSGSELYANREQLRTRRLLGLAASAIRNGYEPQYPQG